MRMFYNQQDILTFALQRISKHTNENAHKHDKHESTKRLHIDIRNITSRNLLISSDLNLLMKWFDRYENDRAFEIY